MSPLALQAALVDPQVALPATILRLQRLAGNRAVQGLLQRKATVGPADDPAEREADRMAAEVLNAPTPSPAMPRLGPVSTLSKRAVQDVIRRTPEPALVKSPGGAGLHKSDRKKAGGRPVKVRSGGLFGMGIKLKIPAGAEIVIDHDKPVTEDKYVWARYGGREGYVKKAHLDEGERIGTSPFYTKPGSKAGFFRIYDKVANEYLTKDKADALKDGIRDVIAHLVQTESATGLNVKDKKKLIENILHQAELGTELNAPLWGEATGNVATKIIPRVNADRTRLIDAHLITADHQLRDIEFTGADFHKHGQAPLFLTFKTSDVHNPDPRKIVYKPGNLDVDAQIFGREGSLARALDITGVGIPQYTILPRGDVPHEKYGYMEFVKSGGPTTSAELLGVYKSLAANMALSYLVGLEDVHHENLLLLNDRVQVIDMEATTGLFKKVTKPTGELDPSQGGFAGQLWLKGLNEGIKPKLQSRAADGSLKAAPATTTVLNDMGVAFKEILDRAKHSDFDVGWQAQITALGGKRSRVVPIPTADLYNMIAPAKRRQPIGTWTTWVNSEDSAWLVKQAVGQTGNTPEFVKRVMCSPGTYNALLRGEVPFFSRELGSNTMYDEEGNTIDATGCAKIGGAIGTRMEERRTELKTMSDTADVYKIFGAQILPNIQAINDELLKTIAERK